MSESMTTEVTVTAGTFYVRVLAAERRSYYAEGRQVEEIQPRVQISTDPEFQSDTDLGHMKIRGRKYAIEHIMKRVTYYPQGEPMQVWQSEASYRGGFRNDKGQRVNRETKAYDALSAAEKDAVEFFTVTHPEFERESTRLLLERDRDNHLAQKRHLELEADQHDIKAAQLQKQIDDLLAA